MTTPEPSWAPLGAAVEAALHLRFAITPTGPSFQHLPGRVDAVTGSQPQSAWHELTVAALLVCLMAEETAIGAATTPGAVADLRLLPPPQADLAGLAQAGPARPQPEAPGPLPAAESGLATEEDWTRWFPSGSGTDGAWPLA